ncbi:hypothetical protein ACP4OV_011238 [Aristida adscensionis]
MAHAQEIHLQIKGAPGQEEEEPGHEESRREAPEPAARRPKPMSRRRGIRWWALVLADTLMLLSGETVAPLLGRLYFNSGGGSMWMKTLAQSAGAPLLVIPLLLTPRAAAGEPRPAAGKVAAVCVGLGLLIACDNLMYSYGLLYLPVSTFSLVAATQLAFNAVTSRLINAQQRFTAPILNSVVVVTFSAVLLGVGDGDDDEASGAGAVPRGKHALGFVITLSASAVYALVLSLFEVAFEKVIKVTTLRWVLMVQLCTDTVASAASVAGLFASGEWRTIRREMAGFKSGSAGYVATMAGVAVGWQASTLGAVRLITRASSLFANVSGTLALPLVPVFAVALFGDKMTGTKAVAMLMAVWGFLSYVYQHYLDDRRAAALKPEGENGG